MVVPPELLPPVPTSPPVPGAPPELVVPPVAVFPPELLLPPELVEPPELLEPPEDAPPVPAAPPFDDEQPARPWLASPKVSKMPGRRFRLLIMIFLRRGEIEKTRPAAGSAADANARFRLSKEWPREP